MKGLLKFCVWVAILVIGTIVTLHLTSCNEFGSHKKVKTENDSVMIVKALDKLSNPEFETVEDISKYRQRMVNDRFDDSIFASLPEETFINVATVVHNRDNVLTKSAIVKEYLHGEDVYNNLPVTKPIEVSSMCTESIDTVKDTIINGKHFKLIKEGHTHVR